MSRFARLRAKVGNFVAHKVQQADARHWHKVRENAKRQQAEERERAALVAKLRDAAENIQWEKTRREQEARQCETTARQYTAALPKLERDPRVTLRDINDHRQYVRELRDDAEFNHQQVKELDRQYQRTMQRLRATERKGLAR
ncbi:hypothetical protein ACSNOI_46445 [Actinomadura kijaniata]|uniref:hypothetical protein n=1 Tax=Actinomadura kijaniata TaxID=46161 RepID=UPI003F1BEBC2